MAGDVILLFFLFLFFILEEDMEIVIVGMIALFVISIDMIIHKIVD
jgi:hypothetical protein